MPDLHDVERRWYDVVFKAVISRAGGTPWPETNMTSAKWLKVPLEPVVIEDLIATQDGVYFEPLSKDWNTAPVGGDKYPHVISFKGELYLEDGHHRVIRDRLDGFTIITARVLTL
jgi:hypothetical protein